MAKRVFDPHTIHPVHVIGWTLTDEDVDQCFEVIIRGYKRLLTNPQLWELVGLFRGFTGEEVKRANAPRPRRTRKQAR